MCIRDRNPDSSIKIAMCGKYTELHDAYKSITESFIHAGVENNTKVHQENEPGHERF